MKLTKLSDELLRYMVKCYSENQRTTFVYQEFKDLFPDVSDDLLTDAFKKIDDDGYLDDWLTPDDVVSDVALSVRAVVSAEENTLLRKGYLLAKEIKSLL